MLDAAKREELRTFLSGETWAAVEEELSRRVDDLDRLSAVDLDTEQGLADAKKRASLLRGVIFVTEFINQLSQGEDANEN